MIKAKIKLFASLRNGRFDIAVMDLADSTTISDIISRLNIDKKDAAIIFINGIHADFNTLIKEGDDVAIFPPVGGG